MLIVSLQEDQQKLLQYPATDFDLISNQIDHEQDNGNYKNHREQGTKRDQDNETRSTIWTQGQVLQGTGFRVARLGDIASGHGLGSSFDSNGSHKPLPNISLTSQELTRLKMAWRKAQLFKSHDLNFLSSRLIAQRSKDWPGMKDIFDELPIALGFGAAALIYGGLHALAWFAHFDSSTEQLLWRISACLVMGGVPVIFALYHLVHNIQEIFDTSPTWGSILRTGMGILAYLLTSTAVLVFLAYALARGYLVIECFINLSHLPAGVYDIPSWSAYFPHIS